MNWLVFAGLAWVALGLDVGLSPLLAPASSGIAPSFVMIVLACVAMSARPMQALWGGLILGLLLDLTRAIPLLPTVPDDPPTTAVVLGPGALGCLLASQLVVAMRALMIRRNPLTVAFLAMLCTVASGFIVAFAFWIRSWIDPMAFAPVRAMLIAGGSGLYTAIIALPVSLVLLPLMPALGLHTQPQRRGMRA